MRWIYPCRSPSHHCFQQGVFPWFRSIAHHWPFPLQYRRFRFRPRLILIGWFRGSEQNRCVVDANEWCNPTVMVFHGNVKMPLNFLQFLIFRFQQDALFLFLASVSDMISKYLCVEGWDATNWCNQLMQPCLPPRCCCLCCWLSCLLWVLLVVWVFAAGWVQGSSRAMRVLDAQWFSKKEIQIQMAWFFQRPSWRYHTLR